MNWLWPGSRSGGSRPALTALALLFAAATLLYNVLWLASTGRVPRVELGFDDVPATGEPALLVTGVRKESPAEKAGLQAGDRILTLDGQSVPNESARAWKPFRRTCRSWPN